MKIRQRVLDLLNANPGSTAAEIFRLIPGARMDTVSRYLAGMVKTGECTRVIGDYEHGCPYRYTAIAEVAAVQKRPKPVEKGEMTGARYVNDSSKHRPIKNPDAMGSGGLLRCGFASTEIV